ncbi:heat shock protein Hsp18 [Clostridium manihotivorum]|uniref:Heat-shock protein n=1 Tax=Clostridium manihotivorum TaxID=2320868 RepID=A0A3R5QZW0_9CLOT|nr:heat shock protein Hsp18 [Clostridium manihotivorum]QAA33382.1 heat-shock protein [Clostridium manihotivorum]
MFEMIPFRKSNLSRGDDFFTPFFKNFFDDDFFTEMTNINGSFKVDLKETDENYLVEADLPGIKKDAIDIDYSSNNLIISAKRNDSLEETKENYVRRERHYGEFKRSFYVDNVDENSIDASFKDGVLRIVLPKKVKGEPKNRKIDIH